MAFASEAIRINMSILKILYCTITTNTVQYINRQITVTNSTAGLHGNQPNRKTNMKWQDLMF